MFEFFRKQKRPFFGNILAWLTLVVAFLFFLSVFYGIVGRVDPEMALKLAPISLLSDWMLPLALFFPLYATGPLFLSLIFSTFGTFYGGRPGTIAIYWILFADIFITIFIFYGYFGDFPALRTLSRLLTFPDMVFFSTVTFTRVMSGFIIIGDPYYAWD